MKVFHPSLLLLLFSIEEIVCQPTRIAKAIHLPLQFIKRTAIDKRSSSLQSTILNDADISELAISVNIGTPSQAFTLLFDTGSADTWVPSTSCSVSDGCPSFLNRYSPSSSSSFQSLNEDVNIAYLTGTASGTYFTDTFTLADGYTIQSQTLALMNSSSGAISNQQKTYSVIVDGVLGAGLPGGTVRSLNGGNMYSPIPVALYNAGLIPKPVFSFAIGSSTSGKVVFGDIITDQSTTDFIYSPLVSPSNPSKWNIYSLGFEFQGNFTRTFKFNQKTPAAIDTGTNFLYLPTALAKELANTITSGNVKYSSGLFQVDCSYSESTSVLKSYFPNSAGKNVYISLPISKLVAKRDSDGACFFLFSPSDSNLIFGNMFLRNFVTVFDFGNSPQVGFAPFVENQVQITL